MKNNLHKNIRISELAEDFNYSHSTIYRLFKQNMDSAPQDFLTHQKWKGQENILFKPI